MPNVLRSRQTHFARSDAAEQLWQLVAHTEDSELTLEAMELRRLFAEQKHRLDGSSLKKLAALALTHNLPAAAEWCRNEAENQHFAAPGFFRRLRALLDSKSGRGRNEGTDGHIAHGDNRKRTMPR